MGSPVATKNPVSSSWTNEVEEFITDVLAYRRDEFTDFHGSKVPLGRLKQTVAHESDARMSRFKIGDFAYTAWLSDTLAREVRRNQGLICLCLVHEDSRRRERRPNETDPDPCISNVPYR